jgi:hypothetical protein
MHWAISNRASGKTPRRSRTTLVVSILAVIALVHIFRLGTYLRGSLFTLYYSYFSDIVVPFGMYFLLCLKDDQIPFVGDWRVKAVLVFAVACSAEVMQAFGVPLLGQTFDPLDVVMFGGGVALAVVVDRVLFARLFPRWSPDPVDPSDAIQSKAL